MNTPTRRSSLARILYSIPLGACRLTSLTFVKLCCGVEISNHQITSISLPKLITLVLEKVKFGDEFLEIAYAPRRSRSSRNLLIQDRELTFHVEAVNLRSFVYSGVPHYSDLQLLYCENLQHLSFSNATLHDHSFSEAIRYRLPLLESSSFFNCKFEHITIRNQHLKRLVFRGNKRVAWWGQTLRHRVWFLLALKALIFPGRCRRNHRPPLPTLKHLKITIDRPSTPELLREALRWAAPSVETPLNGREKEE
ncbi:hypothetical protein L484_000648 [Morus notabilis]|uniref:F-box/FBD/LRR-repeat protein n=1 Tax=Morus notabilis TaxID=981085 RepID=W9SPA0_9ROSA|nr:hypothetical protein L484_000648 [Morus notabilis]